MTIKAVIGQAQALDGREAGLQATHQALNRLGSTAPILAIAIASHQYEAHQIIHGIASLIGNTPLIGFSTSSGLTSDGLQTHSVLVALISASEARAEVRWLPGYTQASREVTQQLASLLSQNPDHPTLIFADGFNIDAQQLCSNMPIHTMLMGGLSCGDLHSGTAYQFGNNSYGAGGLAVARLEGRIRIGIGAGHGWQPVGTHFRITRSRGFWLRMLDGRPASESYARLFGHPAREWAFPPLNHLIRLYPLGIPQEGEKYQLRSPIRVEADGSFRLNTTVEDGSDAYLLVGSITACQEAARQAAQAARRALGNAKPALALVLADVAWQMLFESQPGTELAPIQDVLGMDVPILGGYTLGQIVPGDASAAPQFLNQHISVIVFGEPGEGQ